MTRFDQSDGTHGCPCQRNMARSQVTSRSAWLATLAVVLTCVALGGTSARAQPPPVLTSLFPAGGKAGSTVEVTVSGNHLDNLKSFNATGDFIRSESLDSGRFRLVISADAPPGAYDLWAVGDQGISAPRPFLVGNRSELLEPEENLDPQTREPIDVALDVPLDVVVHGRISQAGEADQYRFVAPRGRRVVVECQAERIESPLRAVLEILDDSGRRLAVNRGYFGTDPLIDFLVPADGAYIVRIYDLTSSGSLAHIYRLELDTGPRVAFALPNVVERGKASRVTLYGWNLHGRSNESSSSIQPEDVSSQGSPAPSAFTPAEFDRLEVEIPATLAEPTWPVATRLAAAQAPLVETLFPFYFPGCHAPVMLSVTDVPVVMAAGDHQRPLAAQEIDIPCEVNGQLIEGDATAWFSFASRRGEVLFFEGFGQRIQSPVDLQLSLFDSTGHHLLAQFGDEPRNLGGSFPTSHLDPSGRWVCPDDGRYLLAVRNLIGASKPDSRRVYRLGIRREEPDFQILAVSPSDDSTALNIPRGGRQKLDLLAFRRRGCEGPIRVSAQNLPAGVECPDVWLGPGVERATLVVSTDSTAREGWNELHLVGEMISSSGWSPSPLADTDASSLPTVRREVRGGHVVRSRAPLSSGRITSTIPYAVTGDAFMRITADGHQPMSHHLYGELPARHAPGGVIDIAIQIERRHRDHAAPVKVTGVGLPPMIENQTAVIPAGQDSGYLSFYLPSTLPVGQYSLAVQAETTVPTADQRLETVAVVSNSVAVTVHPPLFQVAIDPFSVTRARRGDILQLGYSCRRLNGFIGKMHTELASPGFITDVPGLLARGVTFVGQTERGTLQIVVNEDAPLGPQPFLRLFTVGVVEDEPVSYGSSVFPLEIVE